MSISPDLFGLPNEGFHSYRLFDFAILDIIGTIMIALVIDHYTDIPLWKILLGLFIFAELMHYVVGVDTKVMQLILNNRVQKIDSLENATN